MTKSTEDLLVHISKDHLVKELGGASSWTWKYPEIVPGENKAMSDAAGKQVCSFFLLLSLSPFLSIHPSPSIAFLSQSVLVANANH